MERIAYYNGNIGAPEDLTVPFLDRVCFFGDGVYEATIYANGHIFLLNEHLDRFYRSAGAVGIEIPYTRAELTDILYDVASRVTGRHNVLYFQVTRGTAPRSHAFPKGNVKANLWIMVTPKVFRDYTTPIALTEMEDKRFLYCNVKTLNLLPAVLAAQKAEENGCYECVLHRGDIVTEGSHSNISILKDNVLYSHPNDEYILPGIAKNHLFLACEALGIPVVQEAFTLEDLVNADEVIVTSSTNHCSHADTFCGRPVGCKAQSTMTAIREWICKEYLHDVGYEAF